MSNLNQKRDKKEVRKIPPQNNSMEDEVESSIQYPIYDHTTIKKLILIRFTNKVFEHLYSIVMNATL